MKKCKKCLVEKPATDFYRERAVCKACMSILQKEWYAANKDKHKLYAATSRSRVGDDRLDEMSRVRNRRFYKANRGRLLSRDRSFREKNPKIVAAHKAVAKAKESGGLVVPDACQQCDRKVPLHASHDDYDKPLEVEWLCARCHNRKDKSRERLCVPVTVPPVSSPSLLQPTSLQRREADRTAAGLPGASSLAVPSGC